MQTLVLRNLRPAKRQWAVLLAIFLFLPSACSDSTPPVGELGAVEGFVGVVAVEEPRAALLAQDILSAGGTASDAATAAFFAMTVTYPVGVGLGGGGICIVYDAISATVESLDFLPRPAAAGGEVLIPGSLRGMASLHARYGRLRWSQVVTPAERMARFGHPMSRALNRRLANSKQILDGDLMLKRLFLSNDGAVKAEGVQIEQVELATVLGRIRAKGVSDFHGGESGKLFVEDTTKLGGKITIDEIRKYIPSWKKTRTWEFGNLVVHGPTEDIAGGRILASMVDGFESAGQFDATTRLQVTAAAIGDQVVQSHGGDAALAIIDSRGNAVSCQFTMGKELGMGRMLPSLGFAATSAASPIDHVAPMLASNPHLDQGYFAAASSQGLAGLAALAPLVVGVLEEDQELAAAISALRAVKLGTRGEEITETGDGRGARIGLVQAAHCLTAVTRSPELCTAVSDPRGYGLAPGQVR